MKKSNRNRVRLAALALSLGLAVLVAGCGEKSTSPGDRTKWSVDDPVTVKMGVVGEEYDMFEEVIIPDLADEGIVLELVKFSDYKTPNPALDDGEVDLNAFQHKAYLQDEIDSFDYEIEAIGNTYISATAIYSDKGITSVDDLQDGDKIAIANDPTNGGRALKLLEKWGAITVVPDKGYVPEVSDITDNPKNLEIVEMDAATVYSILPDVAAGVINGNYAFDQGLIPAEDGIFLDTISPGEDSPFINVIVARAEETDSAVYKRVVEAYQTPEVATLFQENYKGAYIPAWTSNIDGTPDK